MNNKFYTVCGITDIDGKVLLVRHTYGAAKDRILLPGGFVHENELPTSAAEREILTTYRDKNYSALEKSGYVPKSSSADNCVIFGI